MIVSDPEVERFIRLPLQDELIVASELELRAKETAGIGVAQDPRLGGHSSDIEPCAAREEGAHQRPHAEEERIVG